MTIRYYPSRSAVDAAIEKDQGCLALISFDGKSAYIGPASEYYEHHILLSYAGLPATKVDSMFRIFFDSESADWTFVCPPDYKGISFENRRIKTYYNDGISTISYFLDQIGVDSDINIPRRYIGQLSLMGKTEI